MLNFSVSLRYARALCRRRHFHFANLLRSVFERLSRSARFRSSSLTTRDNGFSEIIEDGVHGSIVDHATNTAALKDAIEFWCDASAREKARPAILARASQFDISRNVEQTLGLLLQDAASAAAVSGKMRNT